VATALARAPDLTVRGLRVRALEWPSPRPAETAAGNLAGTSLALLDLQTEEGPAGAAYVACYSPVGLAATVAALGAMELAGRPLKTLADDLRRELAFTGTAGVLGYALGGLDMAAWDALARANEQPLAVLLGASARARIPAYGSLRSMRGDDAEERRAEGFTRLKLKVRAGDLSAIERVRATGAEVMVDFNQTLTLPDALELLPRLDGVVWIEEPLPAGDLAAYAQLTARSPIPIQSGESWWSPEEARRALAARAQHEVMPDVARIGGVTGFLRAAQHAHAHGVRVSSHMYPEVSVHLLAALPNAHLLEHFDKLGDLLEAPLRPRDGYATVPAAPGLGLTFTA
jgi:mandelate racemase